jgi:cell division protein FtsQ
MKHTGRAHIYRRKRRYSSKLWHWGDLLAVRALSRVLGCLFLLSAIGYGLVQGEHLDSPGSQEHSLLGRIAPIFGYSAQTIRIAGLKRQQAQKVLAALGIEPGSPLFGFDAELARKLLENIDWVEQAKVRTVFPNQLEIEIVEREPFAIWQNDGSYYVIDRTGVAMSSDVSSYAATLPLVSGRGAQTAVYELFNQLESHSALRAKVKAAARIGSRRWTLYFANNVKVALPEEKVEEALSWIDWADVEYGLLSRGIEAVDLRLGHRAVITPQSQPGEDQGKELKVANGNRVAD